MIARPAKYEHYKERIRSCIDTLSPEDTVSIIRDLGLIPLVASSPEFQEYVDKGVMSLAEDRKKELLEVLYESGKAGDPIAIDKYLNYYRSVGGQDQEEKIHIEIVPFTVADTVHYAPIAGVEPTA